MYFFNYTYLTLFFILLSFNFFLSFFFPRICLIFWKIDKPIQAKIPNKIIILNIIVNQVGTI
uniref:Uncharacterized protein n=1 Tax=Spiroplasma kunkelii TaxID=47834 RepID=Q6XYZ1_SPIKU|nr:hypothetical protein [Spiroplasma kunkelii CR2-3x]